MFAEDESGAGEAPVRDGGAGEFLEVDVPDDLAGGGVEAEGFAGAADLIEFAVGDWGGGVAGAGVYLGVDVVG